MPDTVADSSAQTFDAGPFAAWLAQARESLRSDVGTDVPCGDCVGCCVSSYFIPVRPHEKAALAAVASELLVDAADGSATHTMMGYRADGTCPILHDRKCTIYGQRPQTCRDYDCRIFAAAGIEAGGPEKAVINDRVRRWRFTYPTHLDRLAHDAVLAAATFIRTRKDSFPGSRAPTAPTGIAVLAIKAYATFLDPQSSARDATTLARAIVKASRSFDRTRDFRILPSSPPAPAPC